MVGRYPDVYIVILLSQDLWHYRLSTQGGGKKTAKKAHWACITRMLTTFSQVIAKFHGGS